MSTPRCAPWGSALVCALVVASASTSGPAPVYACASCGCGAPTLTAMGLEKPFRNRIRLALEQRLGAHEMGSERTLLSRTALSGSYSPAAWLTLGAQLPFIASFTAVPRRPATTVYGLGDLELLVRALVLRDRRFSPRHLVGLLAGLKAPTGPHRTDSRGYPASDDLQPGSGSWDGLLGASYSYFGDPVAVFLSASYPLTSAGSSGFQRGGALGATALGQLPLGRRLAVLLGLELGHTQRSRLASAVPAPDTGGTLLSISQGLLLALRTDWLLRFIVQTPVVQAWHGQQHESPTGVLSFLVDL